MCAPSDSATIAIIPQRCAGNLTWLEMGAYIKICLHWTDWGYVKDVMGENLVPIQARIYRLAKIPANKLG